MVTVSVPVQSGFIFQVPLPTSGPLTVPPTLLVCVDVRLPSASLTVIPTAAAGAAPVGGMSVPDQVHPHAPAKLKFAQASASCAEASPGRLSQSVAETKIARTMLP